MHHIQKYDSVHITLNSKQSESTGTGDLKLSCIAEPAWKADDETLLE